MTRLIDDLLALEKRVDRATLASLRRGLGKEPGSAGEMYPFVLPRISDLDEGDESLNYWTWSQKCGFIVASLFAWHPLNIEHDGSHGKNLGSSVLLLKQRNPAMEQGVERRFVALLNAEAEETHEHLRTMVGLLKANDIAIDWEQLLADLRGWNWRNRPVQTRWARSYWRASDRSESNHSDSETETEAND